MTPPARRDVRLERARSSSAEGLALIEELARDLSPVRVAPSLRTGAAIVLAAFVALGLVAIGPGGLRADLFAALTRPAFLIVLGGLSLASVGGTLACLAASAPGREDVVRLGVRTAGVALVGAAVVVAGIGLALALPSASPIAADAMCFRAASRLALLPALVVTVLCLRGWVARPLLAATAAWVGAASLAALLVHFSCPLDGPRHLLLGHLAVPVGLTALLALPLAALLRRFGR